MSPPLQKHEKKRIRATSCRIQPQICLKYTSVPAESRGAQRNKRHFAENGFAYGMYCLLPKYEGHGHVP